MFTSLANLIARRTPVDWFEGVAIVQALGKMLVEEPIVGRHRLSDFDAIAVTSEGDVLVTGGPGGDGNPVNDLGRLLSALVPAEHMPAPLRAVAAKASSPTSPYRDVRELTEALTYFERPDLSVLVRDVYQRWLLLPPEEQQAPKQQQAPERAAQPAVEGERAETKPPAEETARQAPRAQTPRLASPRALVVASVTLTAIVALTLWATWRDQSQDLPAVKPPTAFVVAGPVTEPAPAVTATRESIPPPARLPQVKAPERPSSPRQAPTSTVAAAPAAAAGPPLPRPSPPPLSPRSGVAARPAAPLTEPEPDDTTIYSPDSPDVKPPVPMRIMQPTAPRPGVRTEDLPMVEVVVSARGEVESIRLIRANNVLTWGNLSVVKSWRFHPATKNGRPVRYRQTLQLTLR